MALFFLWLLKSARFHLKRTDTQFPVIQTGHRSENPPRNGTRTA
ncbi:MAG: hypothetical protein ACI8R4_000967 [Paracoccaceae bacterium]|jgi:hypothetical protein